MSSSGNVLPKRNVQLASLTAPKTPNDVERNSSTEAPGVDIGFRVNPSQVFAGFGYGLDPTVRRH